MTGPGMTHEEGKFMTEAIAEDLGISPTSDKAKAALDKVVEMGLIQQERTDEDIAKETAAVVKESLARMGPSNSLGAIAAKLAELYKRQRKCNATLDKITQAMKPLKAEIERQFDEHGMNRLTVNGETIYKASDYYMNVKRGCAPELNRQLRAMPEWAFLAEAVNMGQIKAFAKETCKRDDQDMVILPPEFDELVEAGIAVNIKCRKAN